MINDLPTVYGLVPKGIQLGQDNDEPDQADYDETDDKAPD